MHCFVSIQALKTTRRNIRSVRAWSKQMKLSGGRSQTPHQTSSDYYSITSSVLAKREMASECECTSLRNRTIFEGNSHISILKSIQHSCFRDSPFWLVSSSLVMNAKRVKNGPLGTETALVDESHARYRLLNLGKRGNASRPPSCLSVCVDCARLC